MLDERLSGRDIRYLLLRKTFACERHRAAVARQIGVNETEMRAIICLAYEGHLTPGQLGERIGLTSGGVAAMLQRLTGMGYIDRMPHPRDRRSQLVFLTPKCVEVSEAGFAELVDDMDRVFDALPEPLQRELAAYLDDVVKVSDTAAEHAAEAAVPDELPHVAARGLWS